MAFKFPSDEWVKEFASQLNASEAYAKSAEDWEGDFIFISEPDKVSSETRYLFVGLNHGKCTDAAEVASENEREAAFVIRAPYSNWRKVIEGKLDPIQGMMTRKLKLKGDMTKILRYPKAAKELVNCVSRVPTDFGD
ncbi:MAG: sterol carrier protein [Dehalococcoidia bacterium]|nr:MAG: sterol carrier protein [Dehalococcoidia bacterium]